MRLLTRLTAILFAGAVSAQQVVLAPSLEEHSRCSVRISEGDIPFEVPGAGKAYSTHYWKYTPCTPYEGPPLVVLHGGPGAVSQYLWSLGDLAERFCVPVVFYDQLGNGLSTHLPEKMNDTEFWTPQLFLAELNNVVSSLGIADRYDLLGHSWGGMLAAEHAVLRPSGLRRLVLSSSPASMKRWAIAAERLRARLPKDVQDALTRNEENGTTDSEEYQAAVQVYYENFLCRMQPLPDDLVAALEWLAKDQTVYLTMNGPNEFYIVGSLKTWSIEDRVHLIDVPTLVTNGLYDEAQDIVIQPFLDDISNVRWHKFMNSAHTAHHEERALFVDTVANFLAYP